MTLFHSELTYPATATACAIVGSVFDVKSRRVPNVVTLTRVPDWTNPASGVGRMEADAQCAGRGIDLRAGVSGVLSGGRHGRRRREADHGGGMHRRHGPHFNILALTAIAGGVMAVGLALVRGKLQETLMNVGELFSHHRHNGLQPHPDLNITNARTLRLPYALAIAGGCILTLYFQVA